MHHAGPFEAFRGTIGLIDGMDVHAERWVVIVRDADRWLEANRGESIGSATERDLQAWLFTQGSVRQRNAALVAVQFFLTWAQATGLVEHNAAQEIELL
jgi:hypothetical protein